MATYQSQYTGAQIDQAIGAALTPDTSLSQTGKLADAKAAGDAVSAVSNELNSIENFKWSSGFINSNGNIDSASDPSRLHSDYLLCPAETQITYIAETAHSGVLGISFYDSNKTIISGVANNGTNGEAQTVTSPKGTFYCRLSTKATFLNDSYYAPATRTLDYVAKQAHQIAESLSNYIPFATNTTNRASAVSIVGLLYAIVEDGDYQIALEYQNASGNTTSTSWLTAIDLRNYKKPSALRIRRADNGNMAAGEANKAVKGLYLNRYATNQDVYEANGIAYVDGTDGNDSNDGINPTTAFATIQAAINAGYKKILVREGTYTSAVFLGFLSGVSIKINKSYSVFNASTSNTNPKVVIDCDSTLNIGLRVEQCVDCEFEGIEVKNSVQSGVFINRSEGIRFKDCVVHDIPSAMGYEVYDSNVDFDNCGAYNIGTYGGSEHRDGFNFHNTGTQNLLNCWANYCEDDGVSHHDACEGYVIGGEWHHCGKGGVCTPTHGAKVDISGVYVHDCGYGIYAGNDTASLAKTFNISNSVCKNNTVYDIHVTNNTANIWNCIYDTINHSGTGTNNILT